MIRLFVVDLDGCISHPFVTPDWEAITAIRSLNIASKTDSAVPPITICTGRPQPYAEAVAQWLDIGIPFAFESGAGLYYPKVNLLEWAPEITRERLLAIDELKAWTQAEIIPKYPGCIPEFTKRSDVGLVHPDEKVNRAMYEEVKPYVESNYPDFEVHETDVSVNIILTDCNKGTGVRLLSEKLEVPLDEIAYIGDSSGDVPAMLKVKRAFAPANARDVAKKHAEVIEAEATQATLAAYKRIVEANRLVQAS